MPPLCFKAIARQLAQAAAGAGAGDLPDPELLRLFLNDRDETAFAALVRRHGPMVLGVCRCVVRNRADAEDAFQAVFLTLARRAGSISKAGSLASWLHGTAYRTARKALAARLRRRAAETEAPARLPAGPDELSWAEVQAIVHEELLALPERLRRALVLCYLEGATQGRAAEALGATPAAVKKRLERGREQLRARLARRGLGPTAVLAALATPAVASTVPPVLAESVARLALPVATGSLPVGAVPQAIQSLVEQEVTPMLLSCWKLGLCVLLAAGAALAGAALQPRTQAQAPAPPAVVPAADKKPAR
jgi:RNA polymerase sigma factor (sigma-70 family)